MNSSKETDPRSLSIRGYIAVLVVVWTLIVSGSLAWNMIRGEREVLSMARIQARVAHQRDVIYRRWNMEHGGIYVPVSEKTPPNPHLKVPYREIPGPSGAVLTLMNPAYMTRQLHELAEAAFGVHGHITSLNPLRPENAPDPWEAEALRAFESGEEEISSIEKINGESYMRLMRPLVTEEDCLRCHAEQGYKIGDIRGGISVAVPMAPLWAIARSRILSLSAGHGLIWLVGLIGVGFGSRRLVYQILERKRVEEVLRGANRKLIEMESLREDLVNMVVHDMKNPVANSMLALDIIALETTGELNEKQVEFLDMAKRNQFKLSEMMTNLLEISRLESGGIEVRKERLHIRDLIDRAIRRQAVTLKAEEKKIHVWIQPEACWIESDEKLIERILSNILTNAIRHSYPKGEISVSVESETYEGGVSISVRDNGEGIAKEYHEKIFEKFGQADLREMGRLTDTGLGLAFCKMAIEALGGGIRVESERGNGSCFTISLPDALKSC